jgi:Cys-tRNA synthase (O-phospho-L-seryl-tRNA:Cys-tRNA synthase)
MGNFKLIFFYSSVLYKCVRIVSVRTAQMRTANNFYSENLKEKDRMGDKRKWQNNIKMGPRGMGSEEMERVHLAMNKEWLFWKR